MKLDGFLPEKERLDKQYTNFLKLKKLFEEKGIPENIAIYRASKLLEPKKLKKIKMLASKKGESKARVISFFFDNDADIELISKYFNVSVLNNKEPQVGHSDLLIAILKEMDKIK